MKYGYFDVKRREYVIDRVDAAEEQGFHTHHLSRFKMGSDWVCSEPV